MPELSTRPDGARLHWQDAGDGSLVAPRAAPTRRIPGCDGGQVDGSPTAHRVVDVRAPRQRRLARAVPYDARGGHGRRCSPCGEAPRGAAGRSGQRRRLDRAVAHRHRRTCCCRRRRRGRTSAARAFRRAGQRPGRPADAVVEASAGGHESRARRLRPIGRPPTATPAGRGSTSGGAHARGCPRRASLVLARGRGGLRGRGGVAPGGSPSALAGHDRWPRALDAAALLEAHVEAVGTAVSRPEHRGRGRCSRLTAGAQARS